jgi:hypothetical protein
VRGTFHPNPTPPPESRGTKPNTADRWASLRLGPTRQRDTRVGVTCLSSRGDEFVAVAPFYPQTQRQSPLLNSLSSTSASPPTRPPGRRPARDGAALPSRTSLPCPAVSAAASGGRASRRRLTRRCLPREARYPFPTPLRFDLVSLSSASRGSAAPLRTLRICR